MVGIATGLAQAGLLPFVYSIVTFAVLRPYEFIRNGPAHHRLPVRIVGVGGGVEYGINGPTHHGLEDVALMRVLPEMTLVAPVDRRQAAAALRATATLPGPVYYRLGKDERTEILEFDGTFAIGPSRRRTTRETTSRSSRSGRLPARRCARRRRSSRSACPRSSRAVASVNPAPEDRLAARRDLPADRDRRGAPARRWARVARRGDRGRDRQAAPRRAARDRRGRRGPRRQRALSARPARTLGGEDRRSRCRRARSRCPPRRRKLAWLTRRNGRSPR